MKWLVLAAVGIAIAIVAWWLLTSASHASRSPEATRDRGSASTGDLPGRAALPAAHVTKITPEERRRLDERIATAHAARTGQPAHSAPAAPRLPDEPDSSHGIDHLATHLRVALQEAIPFLAACYEHQAPELATGTTFANMTLTGDPDIGTVIDTGEITDADHHPLPKQLDDCLRGTMQTLQLPPLEEGDSVKIQYSFSLGNRAPAR